ncbi:MAG: hypothetical protein V1753_05595 [Pseudomonadota bacterium]
MVRVNIVLYQCVSISVLLLPLFFAPALWGKDISGNAQIGWRSITSKTEGDKTQSWFLDETYNLGLRKEITGNLSLGTGVGVNISETAESKTTNLYPNIRLGLTNEYFDANGGYQLNERGLELLGRSSDDPRLTDETWTTSLHSKSEVYPALGLRYDEVKTYDQLLPSQINKLSKFYEATTDYTLKGLELAVAHSKGANDDIVQDATQNTASNEGRAAYSQSFFNNRLSSSGAYRLYARDMESVTGGQTVDFQLELGRGAGLYALDTDPATGTLGDASFLVNNTITREGNINIGGISGERYHNIGVELVRPEEARVIHIYTNDAYLDNDLDPIEWDVYWADDNTATTRWTRIQNSDSTYNTHEKRFEISFAPTTARYFKAVNTRRGSSELYVTEMRIFSMNSQAAYTTSSTSEKRQNIIFSTSGTPTRWAQLGYSLAQDENEADPGFSEKRLTHNFNTRFDADLPKDIKTWVQYQKSLAYDSEAEDSSSDIYSVHASSSPLETLTTSLSVSHSAPKVGSQIQSKNTSSLLAVSAKLHDQVDFSTDGSYSYTDNCVSESETASKGVGSSLRLDMTRALTTEFNYNTTWSDQQSQDGIEISSHSSNFDMDMSYRPTRRFNLTWSYEMTFDDQGNDTQAHDYTAGLLLSEKVRLNMSYGITLADEPQTTYSSEVGWQLSRSIFLNSRYDRINEEEAGSDFQTDTVTSTLSASF